MIAESLQEEACLYVLGLLSDSESRAFEKEMEQNSELRTLVASTNNATLALARSGPHHVLPDEVKERLLSSLQLPASAEAVLAFPKRSRLAFLPWAIAACLLGMLAWQLSSHLTEKSIIQAENVARQKELLTAQEEIGTAAQQFSNIRKQLEDELSAAKAERTSLLASLSELEKKDSLAQSQIAVLGSLLKDKPQAVAVSVWNREAQTGQLLVENLPVLDIGRDYQLWIIDPDIITPVSAGVFKVDAQGKVRISFRPNQAVQTAAKFAVTEEKEGGVASPTMDKMVVIGGG